jgi:alkylation response protein AidB-like acyl-CoA dehydrogenase
VSPPAQIDPSPHGDRRSGVADAVADENDERAEFSWDTFEKLQSMELPALQIPAAVGGPEEDRVTCAIATGLARADGSASLMDLISSSERCR